MSALLRATGADETEIRTRPVTLGDIGDVADVAAEFYRSSRRARCE